MVECQLLPTPFVFCHLDHVLSPLLSAKMRLAGESLSRVNIVKRIKIGGRWKMIPIPRNAKGNYDWNAIADGRYYVVRVDDLSRCSRTISSRLSPELLATLPFFSTLSEQLFAITVELPLLLWRSDYWPISLTGLAPFPV